MCRLRALSTILLRQDFDSFFILHFSLPKEIRTEDDVNVCMKVLDYYVLYQKRQNRRPYTFCVPIRQDLVLFAPIYHPPKQHRRRY